MALQNYNKNRNGEGLHGILHEGQERILLHRDVCQKLCKVTFLTRKQEPPLPCVNFL